MEESKPVVVVVHGDTHPEAVAALRERHDVVEVREPLVLDSISTHELAPRPRRAPRTAQTLLALIASAGYSPASLAHIGPKRAEKVVADALDLKRTIDASNARQIKRDTKRRRDALRSLRGRMEHGHPGCTCTGLNTASEWNRNGHAAGCPSHGAPSSAGYGAWSREDQLKELYGDKL